MKRLLLTAAAPVLVYALAGCASSHTGAGAAYPAAAAGAPAEDNPTAARQALVLSDADYLLEMEPSAGGYRLGSELGPEELEKDSFEYRGRQAGHVVYHRKVLTDGDRWQYTDILLHLGPGGSINKIVLLRQFASLREATDFYDREYRRQRDRYYLTEDSGNSGSIRFAKVAAYPNRAAWEAAHRRYLEEERREPFRYYYHPLIAGRTASFVNVRGVPTVALIYEGHDYPGGSQ